MKPLNCVSSAATQWCLLKFYFTVTSACFYLNLFYHICLSLFVEGVGFVSGQRERHVIQTEALE